MFTLLGSVGIDRWMAVVRAEDRQVGSSKAGRQAVKVSWDDPNTRPRVDGCDCDRGPIRIRGVRRTRSGGREGAVERERCR